ncbi:MAG: DUF4132 domain-containing protein [Micrococcales bacterium]|nr:DUF4132 domain-containing protein [Micrococcales bacterium]
MNDDVEPTTPDDGVDLSLLYQDMSAAAEAERYVTEGGQAPPHTINSTRKPGAPPPPNVPWSDEVVDRMAALVLDLADRSPEQLVRLAEVLADWKDDYGWGVGFPQWRPYPVFWGTGDSPEEVFFMQERKAEVLRKRRALDAAARRHPEALAAWWGAANRHARAYLICHLGHLSDQTVEPFLTLVAEEVVASTKAEQAARYGTPTATDSSVDRYDRCHEGQCRPMIDRIGPGLVGVCQRLVVEGSATQRRRALTLAWSTAPEGDERARQWVIVTAAADSAPSVRALSQVWSLQSVPDSETPHRHEAVEAAARRALPRGLSEGLAWVTEAGLPPLRWADGGMVPDVVWQWWVHLAVKAKQVVPGAVLADGMSLVGHTALVERLSGQRFAATLLKAWLDRDLRPPTAEQARAAADRKAATMHSGQPSWVVDQLRQMRVDGWERAHQGLSVAELADLLLPHLARQPADTAAVASKGVLALVAAMGGPGLADPVSRYLNRWAKRTTQARALIELLALVDDPAALHLLVSLSRRPGRLRGRAVDQLAAAARRQGVSVADLVDRVVPDAGLDATGRLMLSYGPRSFEVQLTDSLGWQVRDETGQVLRSLPPARATDDKEAVAAAKTTFKNAKSTVAAVAKTQTPRLRDHMAAGRTWTTHEWEQQIRHHPIMSRLATGLVWQTAAESFRPLSDGTLTGSDDAPVTLRPDAPVSLAHSTTLALAERAAWQVHLADYEVVAPFDQLGHDPVVVADPTATAVDGWRGHTVVFGVLDTQATRRGYEYDHDQGWIHSYHKEYSTLGITVVISFSGAEMRADRTTRVTLTDLSFVHNGTAQPLGQVPAALLTESWVDMAAIAATGPDPAEG